MPVNWLPYLTSWWRAPSAGRINARFTRWCCSVGLLNPRQFLDLSGEVISGHRDRHVLCARIGGKRLILKKEHRVPWRTRWHNWWAGYGLVSMSEREAAVLDRLLEAGVPVPEWIAAGHDRDGRAFLLLRNAKGQELPTALTRIHEPFARWKLAKAIGEAIARLHQAGFEAPDLSAKHILVRRDGSVVLIDWPRAVERQSLDCHRCLSALARLHASLAPSLATSRERMVVIKSWMHALGFQGSAAPMAREALRLSTRFGQSRSIQDQHWLSRPPRLRWVDGESLCVLSRFDRDWQGRTPDWLWAAALQRVRQLTRFACPDAAELLTFPPASALKRLLARILQRPPQSEGVRLAGLALRLQRHRIPVVPIQAFGGRPDGGGFVVYRLPDSHQPAATWLAQSPATARGSLLHRIGQLLRRCHEAGCRGVAADALLVDTSFRPRLRLRPCASLYAASPQNERTIALDLGSLTYSLGLTDRGDVARVVRGYFGTDAIEASTLRIAAKTLCQPTRRAA